MAYRHDGFFYAMDTYREYQMLERTCGTRRGPLEGLGVSQRLLAGPARPSSPAATGLVGSWLMRRLVEAGADVVCLVRDWVPQ